MNPRYHRKRQNSVEKAMRPGVLMLSLLIAFVFIYLLTPPPSAPPAMADRVEDEYASADDPGDFDDEMDHPESLEEESDIAAEEEFDDTAAQDETSHEGGEIGEGYDDPGPRPGDNEVGDESESSSDTAADDESDETPAREGRHRECIYVPGIDTFHVIDDKHLTVSTSPRRIYLVTLWNRCFDLRRTNQIAIKSYSSWTCSHSRDTIITRDSRCIIDDVERVSSNEEAASIVAERSGGEDDG